MKRERAKLTADVLRQHLHYDPDTGEFTWLVDRGRKARAGGLAGCYGSEGYRSICLFGTSWQAHRLAWLYMSGEWPESQIDHINAVKDDNRFHNLRCADRSDNAKNRQTYKNNKLGVKNVKKDAKSGMYVVRLQVNGVAKYIGCYHELELASLVAHAAREKYHGRFACHD